MKKKNVLISTLLVAILGVGSVLVQSAYAFGPGVFSVTRVAPWDNLNVREEPGVSAKVIGKIPADGEGVVVIGNKETIGKNTWTNITWGPLRGWVNTRYLTASYIDDDNQQEQPQYRSRASLPKATDELATTLECGGVKPFWNIDLNENNIQVNIKEDHYKLPIYSRRTSTQSKNSIVIKGRDNGETAKLYLTKDNVCRDGITDINYPYTVKAIINGNTSYSGCCSLGEE